MFWLRFALTFVLIFADEIIYDGSQVFIYSKAADGHYRIVTNRPKCEGIFSDIRSFPLNMGYKVLKEYCPLHLYSHELTFAHLWTLEEHPTRSGFFYVHNTASPDDKWKFGTPKKGAIGRKNLFGPKVVLLNRERFGNTYVSWDRSYDEHNLFKFTAYDKKYHYIENTKHKCLRASPKMNMEKCKSARKFDSAKWELVPRIKSVKVKTKIIFGPVDNLQGPFPDGPYTITVQHGVTRTETSSVRDFQSYKLSLEASIGNALGAANVGFEFTQEIEKTMTTTEESSWVRTETRTVTVPARSKYAIVQTAADIEGELGDDSCQVLNGNIKIYVSIDKNFYDDDGKKINLRKL